MKAMMKYYPFSSLITLVIVSTLVLAMAIRYSERPAYENMDISNPLYQDYSYIWNGIWLTFVTLTTVGYGDFYPVTHLGRYFASLTAMWGIYLISIIIQVTT
jgi:hypothetical protein